MAARPDERAMVSERVAPGMLPRVLNSTDMTIIFLTALLAVLIYFISEFTFRRELREATATPTA
jgi:hypothetical protein